MREVKDAVKKEKKGTKEGKEGRQEEPADSFVRILRPDQYYTRKFGNIMYANSAPTAYACKLSVPIKNTTKMNKFHIRSAIFWP